MDASKRSISRTVTGAAIEEFGRCMKMSRRQQTASTKGEPEARLGGRGALCMSSIPLVAKNCPRKKLRLHLKHCYKPLSLEPFLRLKDILLANVGTGTKTRRLLYAVVFVAGVGASTWNDVDAGASTCSCFPLTWTALCSPAAFSSIISSPASPSSIFFSFPAP